MWPQTPPSPAPADSSISVKLVVPAGYPTPFGVLVDHAKSLGLEVEQTYPEMNAIQGSVTQEGLQKLKQIPGVTVSPVQKMTWGV